MGFCVVGIPTTGLPLTTKSGDHGLRRVLMMTKRVSVKPTPLAGYRIWPSSPWMQLERTRIWFNALSYAIPISSANIRFHPLATLPENSLSYYYYIYRGAFLGMFQFKISSLTLLSGAKKNAPNFRYFCLCSPQISRSISARYGRNVSVRRA